MMGCTLDFILLIFFVGCIAGSMLARGILFAWCITGFVVSGTTVWWMFENAL